MQQAELQIPNKLEEALSQLDLAGILVLQGILNQKALMLLLDHKEELPVLKKPPQSLVLPNRSVISK